MEQNQDAVIGVDVGGTHTDVAALYRGEIRRGKALTTYDDFSNGLLEAVAVAADRHGVSLRTLLSSAQLFVNGTTVVTNTITEMRGARVGVLVTAGNPHAFRIAGGPRTPDVDDHLQTNVPDLVPPGAIVEIHERIDWAGDVLVSLDRDQVQREVRRLVESERVEALAVCFLWSHVNGSHEAAAKAAIAEIYPDLFVTASHEIFPIRGETRRWMTAVLNAFVHERASLYLSTVSQKLRDAGLQGGLAFFQGLGGAIGLERARAYPLALLGSGPAAGATGANALSRRMGLSKVLIGDMGGTSFDTGIITDHRIHIAKNLSIGPFPSGANVVDVVSVGAGGGSIGWVSERGVPQVGPQSAASDPGPAALGRGGKEPTVTDAMVAMGFIDPSAYLGGRIRLDVDAARTALVSAFGQRFGWSAEESAAAMHDLVVTNMANAVREITVGRGHDPRDFVFIAYGGTLPLFACQIAERLGIGRIVVPKHSSVFCANGLLGSDFVMRFDQSVGWNLDDPDGVERVNDAVRALEERATAALASEGFGPTDIRIERAAELRFEGQDYELPLPMPARRLAPSDSPGLIARFVDEYESTYGRGTAWKGVPVSLVNYSVTAIGTRPVSTPRQDRPSQPDDQGEIAMRSVFVPKDRAYRLVPVVEAGHTLLEALEGPAIIADVDTTIYVPMGYDGRHDEDSNIVLTRRAR